MTVHKVLIILLIAALSGGCTLPRRPGPEIDTSQDGRIRGEVTARLMEEPSLDATRLRVEVEGGVVILYGGVDGIAAWQCAIRNAQLVPGVRSVVDYLVIDRGPREVHCLAPRDVDLSLARIVPPAFRGSEPEPVREVGVSTAGPGHAVARIPLTLSQHTSRRTR